MQDKFDSILRADVIEGYIYTGVPMAKFNRKYEVPANVDESNCLRLEDGSKATQLAVMDREVAKRLGDEMRGKMHIDITAAIEAQDIE
jgi:hypothetical protein